MRPKEFIDWMDYGLFTMWMAHAVAVAFWDYIPTRWFIVIVFALLAFQHLLHLQTRDVIRSQDDLIKRSLEILDQVVPR